MAKIFYSMAGEGRGHAVRVRTLVEHLRLQHELVLFAPAEAYDFLQAAYGDGRTENVRLVRVNGLRFRYTGGKLDLFKSMAGAMSFAQRELPSLVRNLRQQIEDEQPDLAISDFEPALPRAAETAGVPWMSLDHQHVLLAYDLSSLPFLLRRYAWWMSWAVRWYYGWKTDYPAVVSSFYTPALKPRFQQVHQVGPILRSEIVSKSASTGDFLLSYLRSNTPENVVEILGRCDCPVRVYGLGQRPTSGQMTFHPIDEVRFVEDLAGCAGLFSAAGNQLLGEALYFGKPVFAIPEHMHHEQQINAHFLKKMGAGDWVIAEDFQEAQLVDFLAQMAGYRQNLQGLKGLLNGTPDAIAAIEALLNHHSTPEIPVAA